MVISSDVLFTDSLDRWSKLNQKLYEPIDDKPNAKTIRDIITAPKIFFTEPGLEKLFAKDKWWDSRKINADRGIQIFFGYQNGDITKPALDELSDVNPHGILVGGTGSGKSFSYYHLVDAICSIYSPNDVRLWFFDGKSVTFSRYAPRGSNERLPHMEACCCTNDAAYAASYYQGYVKSMETYKLMFRSGENPDKYTTDSIKDWNEHWRARAEKDPTLIKYVVPRKVLLIDELAALFTRVEAEQRKKVTDALGQIGKEGRALGHHVICSSQDPDDIPDALMKQAFLRVCLQCFGYPEMSRKMIGTEQASKITQKCGICYIKSKKSSHQEPVRIAIPMTKEQVVTNEKGVGYVNRMYKEAIEKDYKLPFLITYDDAFPVGYDVLEEHYKIYEEKLKDRTDISMDGMFMFGIPMQYDQKQTLTYNRFYRNEPGAHIYAEMDNEEDLFNFLALMVWNVKKHNYDCIVNSQLLEAQDDFLRIHDWTNTPESLLKMKWAGIRDQIYSLYQKRKETGNTSHVWFILVGINSDLDFGMTMDGSSAKEVAAMLSDISRVGIHVCFLNYGKHKSRDEITENVSTCITDLVDKETSQTILKRTDGGYQAGDLTNNYLNIKDRNQFTRVRLFTSPEERGKSMARGVEI